MLWLLALVPVMAVAYVLYTRRKRRQLEAFGDPALVEALMPNASQIRPTVKFSLLMLAYVLLCIAVARPQYGQREETHKRQGIEAIIALDISNSMLAQDVTPSRLDKSKLMVENLVDHFTNDRIGLVVFAGDAFVQLPITSDYVSAKMFLQNISPSLIQTQGTDIAAAIRVAMKSFSQQDNIGRAIVLITDGEDHEGGAEEAAREARKKGINVYILGVGDPKGAPIPIGNGGYLQDGAGETVMSALNEDMCRKVAQAGDGMYIHVDNTSDAQEKLNNALTKLQTGQTDSVVYSAYDEQFQAFGILVLVLLIVEACLLERKNPTLLKIKLFKKK